MTAARHNASEAKQWFNQQQSFPTRAQIPRTMMLISLSAFGLHTRSIKDWPQGVSLFLSWRSCEGDKWTDPNGIK